MKLTLYLGLLMAACAQTLIAAPWTKDIPTQSADTMKLTCNEAGGWTFSTALEQQDGKELLHIRLTADAPQMPPKFNITYCIAQKDIMHLWHAKASTPYKFAPNWSGSSWQNSQLAYSIPLVAFFNENNQNSFLLACSEVYHSVNTQMAMREEGCMMQCEINFFDSPTAPMKEYATTILMDRRKMWWSDAIKEATEWIDKAAHIDPCHIPEEAYAPLYSSWYQFHQDVHAKDIEEECAIASELGMKTIIVDDGWQTDDTNRGYAYCGDWEISAKRFPHMAEHVRNVQRMGMKYMMWYSVPFMGYKSKNFERFRGKFLSMREGAKTAVLDPRFPEVRDFLVNTYEKALREWHIDGFKLDFIDQFKLSGEDPALKENYAGRDYKSVPEATDALMKAIKQRLQSINPDILIEFRQAYMGPAIRQYGNMIRVGDCPGDMMANRIGIANLRLTSGHTAVHADMLEWHPEESDLNVARTILSCMFGVIQYSVMLRDIPKSHRNIIQHWLNFSQQHQETLLKGHFKPHHPEAGFPILEAQNEKEHIIGVYQNNVSVNADSKGKDLYVINATAADGIIAETATAHVTTFDMQGRKQQVLNVKKGLNKLPIPAGGYAKIK